MATVILHIGMHKTGTTSIQGTFGRYDDGRTRYVRLGRDNHGALFQAIFSADPELLERGNRERLDRAALTAALEAELTLPRETFVVSGEGISHFERPDVEALKAFLDARGLAARLVAYVREPIGFASSAFQQRVKGGATTFRIAPPHYRKRFADHVEVFGRDAVTFVPFSREALAEGSAVADFAARAGLDPGLVTEATRNESLSAEAVALLFFWNKAGGREAARRATRKALLAALSDHFPGRFRFSRALVEDGLDADDIRWMEETAGFALMPAAGGGGGSGCEPDEGIGSEAELAAVQDLSLPRLAGLLEAHGLKPPKRGTAAAMLRRLCRHFDA